MKTYKTYKTYLPVFNGFYGTIFEADESNEIYDVNQQRADKNLPELEWDAFEFDYKSYNENVVSGCVDYIEKTLLELGFKNEITNSELVSPREYNFVNDSIDIDIKINLNKVIEYLKNNFKEFKEYIKNNYTSYDGFFSSYSNDAEEWINTEIENSPDHCVGSILNFIILNEIDEPIMDMYDSIQDNYLSCMNYRELTENL